MILKCRELGKKCKFKSKTSLKYNLGVKQLICKQIYFLLSAL